MPSPIENLAALVRPNPPRLTDADFAAAAEQLHCEIACLIAVTQVESKGDGFLPSGRPKILFEAHKFSALTGHRYDATHPRISSRRWNPSLYKGGEAEYRRLEQALELDATAALKAPSWGRFQILGENHAACGYDDVWAYVAAMHHSESHHLEAFCGFVRSAGLADDLREKRWVDFARSYNGPSYAKHNYHLKLAQAYRQAKAKGGR
jgi:hypothetical protein